MRAPATSTGHVSGTFRAGIRTALALSVWALLVSPSIAATLTGAACASTTAAVFAPPRVIEIDAHGGPIFGAFTKQVHEPSFLKPMEVVLTFDDGPMPWITRSILDTLDTYCARATFFSVGRVAIAYPDVVREIAQRGHTLASHTMTHPFNMHRMARAKAEDEIERGFAAVSAAAGAPIAPFFRFPGLADSAALLNYLQQRGIAAFTVDVASNDSYINSPARLTERTLAEIERNKGGIILFHDIKRATAKALPDILKALNARGYKLAHIVSTVPVAPRVDLLADYSVEINASRALAGRMGPLMPFYGLTGPIATPAKADGVVTRIAPDGRTRITGESSPHIANSDGTATRISPWQTHLRTRRTRTKPSP